jgi:UDP-N-acetylmuramate--alanine ligase
MKYLADRIYLIGIKGVGMTMLAQFLKESGSSVSGSDIKDVFLTDKVLHREKIKVFSPFSEKNIDRQAKLIIHSSAFNRENNEEMAFITAHPEEFRKTKILSYAEALGEVFNRHQGIAVCGSHGKTTTSAWLGFVVNQASFSPNVLVGSRVPQFKGSSLKGSSKIFIAETDEYQNKLRYFQPQGVLLNNIDYDHPDFFPTVASYNKVFEDFVKKIPPRGFLVFNNDDKTAAKIAYKAVCRKISYGLNNSAAYQAINISQGRGRQNFSLLFRGREQGRFSIKLIGRHNIQNALAVIAAARELGLSFEDIRRYLGVFKGTERRAQILGRYQGATLIDDYAHHPTEIRATIEGLKNNYSGQRLLVVFHPHTFTRTKALFKDFAASFDQVDELFVLDIYGSAREKAGGVSSRELVKAIKKNLRSQKIKSAIHYSPTIEKTAENLKEILRPGDVLVLMGAGDVFRVGQYILKAKK